MAKRINSIDYIKGLCIIAVIFTHCGWSETQCLKLCFPFTIDMAVPIFMIISGFVCTLSIKRKGIAEYFGLNSLLKKFLRYALPILPAISYEYMYIYITGIKNYTLSVKEIIGSFYLGGIGPGSYYFPVMVQFIFLFPLLYCIFNSNKPQAALTLCAIINLLYEISVRLYGISDNAYRLISFRYIFLIACGIYLALCKEKLLIPNKKNISLCAVSMLIGIGYIILTSYTGYREKLFTLWTTTSMLTAFWIFPIFCLLFVLLKNAKGSKAQAIGKASYHIFLTQMVYFATVSPKIEALINLPRFNRTVFAAISLIICLAVGTVFYVSGNKIEQKIFSFIDKKTK